MLENHKSPLRPAGHLPRKRRRLAQHQWQFFFPRPRGKWPANAGRWGLNLCSEHARELEGHGLFRGRDVLDFDVEAGTAGGDEALDEVFRS